MQCDDCVFARGETCASEPRFDIDGNCLARIEVETYERIYCHGVTNTLKEITVELINKLEDDWHKQGLLQLISDGKIDVSYEEIKEKLSDKCCYKVKGNLVFDGCRDKSIASTFSYFNEFDDYKYCPYCGKEICFDD